MMFEASAASLPRGCACAWPDHDRGQYRDHWQRSACDGDGQV